MINIKIAENGIEMNGHAGYHENGQDIVCAAVSALTCNLVNSLTHLTKTKIRAETESGYTKICWNELTEAGELLVDSWFLGISAVNQNYNCITFR